MSEINEYDGFNCQTCDEWISGVVDQPQPCAVCKSYICTSCTQPNQKITLKEWLMDINNQCNQCQQVGCGHCIRTCYSCWNHGEESAIVCSACATDLYRIDCRYHVWYVCSQCYQKDHNNCPECYANRNFCAKMQ